MPRKRPDILSITWKLALSLSKSQCGILWVNSEDEGNKLYQFLFQYLRSAKKLDKDQLFADMSKQGYHRKQITDATNHLHQKLSNFLLERDLNLGDELQRQQKLANLYFRLGMEEEALGLSEKIRKEAWKREDFNLLIAIIQAEQTALERDWSTPEVFEQHQNLAQEQQKALEQQLVVAGFRALYSRIHRCVLSRLELSPEEVLTEIREVEQADLMQRPEKDLPSQAKLQKQSILYNIARLQKDLARQMQIAAKGIQLFQQYPLLREVKGILYIRWTGVLIMNAQLRGQAQKAAEYREQLQDYYPQTFTLTAEKEFVSIYPFLVFSLSQGEADKLQQYLHEAEAIRPYVNGLPKDLVFRFYFSLLYGEVALGNHENAKQRLEELLQGSPEKAPPGVEINVRLLELIIIKGLKDFELLSYKAESLRKFIARNPSLKPFSPLQKLFSRLSNTNDKNKRTVLLHQTLDKVLEQDDLARLQKMVDYPAWLRASLANKPLIHFFAESKDV